MARIQVQMPDGSIIDAPEGTTKAQIAAKYAKMGGKVPEEPGMFDGAIDAVKNIGTGLAKGFGGLATLAGDAFADDPQTRMAVAAAGGKQPKVGDVSRMVAGMGYQPKTAPERYAQSTAAGVGGALFPGPGLVSGPVKQMAIGGASGLGAEVGNQLSGNNPLAAIGGGLLGGGAMGLATSLKGNAPALARETLEGVSPQQLEQAKGNMMQAQAAGIPINLSQAMERPSNIDSLVQSLANSRYGKNVTQQLNNQPDQVSLGMESQLLRVPGEARAPQIVANNAQDVATKVINNAKRVRTQSWERTHSKGVDKLMRDAQGKSVTVREQSNMLGPDGQPIVTTRELPASGFVGMLPEGEVSKSAEGLMKLAAERPNTGVGAELSALAGRLKKDGRWITDTMQLNEILKDASARLKSPDLATAGIDAGGSKFIGSQIDNLRNTWGEKFEPFRAANAVYRQQTQDIVDPLKKSVVGQLAGRKGAVPDVDAAKGKLTALFDAGTVPGAKSSDILKMERSFRTIPQGADGLSGSMAYQDAVKSWMASKVSAAAQQKGGRIDPAIAGNLEKVFLGSDTKAQGFRDMLVGLARSEGKSDDMYVKGMEKFLKITSRAARRPGSIQGISAGDASDIASQTLATRNGQTTWSPLRGLLIRWSERVNADAYKEMDRLLTSPEGVDMLQKLAKVPATSPLAQTAVATFLGTNAVATDDRDGQ